jgi:hypothetical protein
MIPPLSRAPIHALITVSLGVIEAVEAAGEQGAPGGVLYAAMQAHGASLSQFQSLMLTLTNPGYLVLDGDCYRCTSKTQELKTKLTETLAGFAAFAASAGSAS